MVSGYTFGLSKLDLKIFFVPNNCDNKCDKYNNKINWLIDIY